MSRKSNGFWTPEKDAELSELKYKGLTNRSVSAVMRQPVTSVRDRVKFLDLPTLSRAKPYVPPAHGDMRTIEDRRKVLRALIPGIEHLPDISFGDPKPSDLCCFVVNDAKPFKYCDRPSAPGKSMCDNHILWCRREPTRWEEAIVKDVKK